MAKIYNMSCLDLLPHVDKYDMIFADPPDNLGLGYNVYKDNLPDAMYYGWIAQWLSLSLAKADTVVLSYYWKHDLEIKHMARNLIKFHFPSFSVKTFIWRYNFGQHNKHDCGSGFRYLLRFNKLWKKINTSEIMEMSERQALGDPRANPDGKVPDDVWQMNLTGNVEEDKRKVETKSIMVEPDEIMDIARVTGNSNERRSWHPTQHSELVLHRLIAMHTYIDGKILDLFGGTGTCMRVGIKMGRDVDMCEIDPLYCEKIKNEPWTKKIPIVYTPPIPELKDATLPPDKPREVKVLEERKVGEDVIKKRASVPITIKPTSQGLSFGRSLDD